MQKDTTPSLKGHVRNGKMQQLTGTEKLKDLFYFVLSYTEAAITLVKEHSGGCFHREESRVTIETLT